MSSTIDALMGGPRSKLFSAVMSRDSDEVAKELDNGADANAMEPMFAKALILGTPLMQAATLGDLESAKALANRTKPNVKTRLGRTALMHAAAASHAPIVELLAKMENPWEQDESGRTALFMIGGDFHTRSQSLSEESQIDCARWLLKFGGAELALVADKNGVTALMAAASNRNERLGIFLSEHSDIRAVDGNGRTALMRAAAAGCVELVAALAPLSDIMAVDTNGVSATELAGAFMMGSDVREKICGILLAAHEARVLESSVDGMASSMGGQRRAVL